MDRILSFLVTVLLAAIGLTLIVAPQAMGGSTQVATVPVPLAPPAAPVAAPPAAAPQVAAEPVAALPSGAPEVFVVGDSLTVGAEPWLAGAMARRGLRLAGVDARVSRPVDEGLAVLQQLGGSLPSTVVIALGTNNLGASPAEVDRWVGTARRLVGDRRLIWVNLRCDPAVAAHLERYRAVNAALAAAAPRYGVEIADWDGWAAGAGVPNGRDGVHYTEDAYRLRALFYAAALV